MIIYLYRLESGVIEIIRKFVEVFVETLLSVSEGWTIDYKMRSSQLKTLSGIDSPYDTSETLEIQIDTTIMLIDEPEEQIVKQLLSE